jgi:hypothetical protein
MSGLKTLVELKLTGLPLAYVNERAIRGELSDYLTRLIIADLGFLHKFDGGLGQIAGNEGIAGIGDGLQTFDPATMQALMLFMQSSSIAANATEVTQETSEKLEEAPDTAEAANSTEEVATVTPKKTVKRLSAESMSLLAGMDD